MGSPLIELTAIFWLLVIGLFTASWLLVAIATFLAGWLLWKEAVARYAIHRTKTHRGR